MATATCHIPQYVPKLEPSWDWVDRGRIHGLDGLRAISIVMVLLAHSSGWLMGSDSFISSLASLGSRGVDVFFVISGFLITLLLIRERNRTGTIFLRGFYTRRVLRIVPAYVIFLAFVATLAYFGYSSIRPLDWMIAATYTTSLVTPWYEVHWDLCHTWSLALEEHFYLVWPILFWMSSIRTSRMLLAVGILAAPFVRLILWMGFHLDPTVIVVMTPGRYDPIVLGCVLAYLACSERVRPLINKITKYQSLLISLCITFWILSAVAARFSPIYHICWKQQFECIPVCLLILNAATRPQSVFSQFLRIRPVAALGVLSYSLYLWHMPFLNLHLRMFGYNWPWCISLIFIFAIVSYFVVERPFLLLKEHMYRPISTQTRTDMSPAKEVFSFNES